MPSKVVTLFKTLIRIPSVNPDPTPGGDSEATIPTALALIDTDTESNNGSQLQWEK